MTKTSPQPVTAAAAATAAALAAAASRDVTPTPPPPPPTTTTTTIAAAGVVALSGPSTNPTDGISSTNPVVQVYRDESLVANILQYLDTVELMLGSSRVCKVFKNATETALKQEWFPTYRPNDRGDDTESSETLSERLRITNTPQTKTKEEFAQNWRKEQEAYWFCSYIIRVLQNSSPEMRALSVGWNGYDGEMPEEPNIILKLADQVRMHDRFKEFTSKQLDFKNFQFVFCVSRFGRKWQMVLPLRDVRLGQYFSENLQQQKTWSALSFGPAEFPASEWWSNGKEHSFVPLTEFAVEIVAINNASNKHTVVAAITLPQDESTRVVGPEDIPFSSYQQKKGPVAISFVVRCFACPRIDPPAQWHHKHSEVEASIDDFRRDIRVGYGTTQATMAQG